MGCSIRCTMPPNMADVVRSTGGNAVNVEAALKAGAHVDDKDADVRRLNRARSHLRPLIAASVQGWTGLHISAWLNYVQAAIVLLENGADINLAKKVSRHCFVVLRLSN